MRILPLLLVLASPLATNAQDWVWWEGEAAASHNFNKRDFSPDSYGDKKDALSSGDWLFNGGAVGADPVTAKWKVRVPADGEWQLWARKFWKHGPFEWRFDDGKWSSCSRDIGLADNVVLAPNICANWVALGPAALKGGERTFEIRLTAKQGEPGTACFDCFLLTRVPFAPRGKLKPGEKTCLAEKGWWAWEPDADAFSKEALLDLSFLNEKEAGASGFVKSKDNEFLLGDGKPVRFWGVNCGPDVWGLGRAGHEYLAARLAKCGVNLARLHGPTFDPKNPSKIDAKALDNLHSLVAALKKHGIYVSLSFYFPLWVDASPAFGLDGYDTIPNKHPFASVYFSPKFQDRYRGWAKGLLSAKNPYTGKSLAEETSVAMVELVNEDSVFFWTFGLTNVPDAQLSILEKSFGAWLAKRGGVAADWPKHPHDKEKAGTAGLFGAWDMTTPGVTQGAPKKARMAAQVRFLAETQRAFYADTAAWLKKDVGVKCLVNASNWRTADEAELGAIERWTYEAADVIDRHGYFSGKHEGPRASFSVSVGDAFEDRSALKTPWATPVPFIQYEGRPHYVSELGWSGPNRDRADAPLFAAAYGSLDGMRAFGWFAVAGPSWQDSPSKFPLSTPSVLGQFPAAALIFRRGDIKEGPVVLRQSLDIEKQFDLEGCGFAEEQALDEMRAKDVPAGAKTPQDARFDPRMFLVGKVVRAFGKPGLEQSDLRAFIDNDKKVVKSATGEIACDYGKGVLTVDTPNAQAAAGFLGDAGPINLGDVTIEMKNRYGCVIVVSLDGKPLANSAKVLVQAFTQEKTYGFKVDGSGRIEDFGTGPINIENVEASVTFKGTAPRKATALDEHGYSRAKAELKIGAGATMLDLPAASVYVVVEK
ncbi:MAG: hypothetical protein K8T20_19220 [Planctomycetes bacterium]|nr:hypothetical protein [Planctomycetota bacterium]